MERTNYYTKKGLFGKRCMVYLLGTVWCIIAKSRSSIGSCAIQESTMSLKLRNRESIMVFSDRILYCRDCNQEFIFTAGEQEFFESRGLTNAPSRCPSCRATRKQAGGGRSDQGTRYQERQARPMYTAICANCGSEAQVPFQPRDGRPVYCNDCYQAQGSGRRSDHRSHW